MVAIIDYGMGNLRSVEKAIQYIGAQAVITEDAERIRRADHVILPGVGAFRDAIHRLRETGLDQAVLEAADAGKPLLGICLGMQLFFEGSEENGTWEGLGLIPGTIRHLPEAGLKVPHMGWNTLETKDCVLFREGENPFVYFVHTYCAPADCPAATARCIYGAPFTAAVQRGNVMATQFHPEKSGEAGLEMLRRFVRWEGETC